MKTSPLRLRWVTYPSASYELIEDFEGDNSAPISAEVDAEVKFNEVGEHFVFLRLSSKQEDVSPYRFSLTAIAAFEFDLEIARREYKIVSTPALVPLIGVNVARIVYAGAREFIAMLTSRATHGAAVLDSVLLEPSDVKINSDMEPMDMLRTVFQATADEITELEARIRLNIEKRDIAALEPSGNPKPKKKAKK